MLRQLRRSFGFTLIVTMTVAIGIAINATAFTFYDAIALKPLAVENPSSVVRIAQDARIPLAEELPFSAYQLLRRDARSLGSVVASSGPQIVSAVLPTQNRDAAGDVVSARFVSGDFASQLRIGTRLGRWFTTPDEDAVVLDYGFWVRALGAAPGVIGTRVVIHDHALTIVGIAPEGFAGTGMPAAAPDLWLPMSLQPSIVPGSDWRYDDRAHWQVLGRLAPAGSIAQVNSELAVLRRALPDSSGKPLALAAKHATFFQTDSGEFAAFEQVSAAFMVALTLILSIGIVNLVNLCAARNAGREREIVVRLALGASRARIARQLASESLLLSLVGGALGLVASQSLAEVLRAWVVGTTATLTGGGARVFIDLSLDWRVATYTMALAAAIGLVVGLWPALGAARLDVNGVLRQGSGSTADRAAWGKRNLLLVVQVAGCVVLLTTAGLLLGGLRSSRAIEPGFDASHLLLVPVTDGALPPAQRAAMRAEVERRVAALPGVEAVAWSRRIPFGGTHLKRFTARDARITLSIDNVSDAYFDAMGIRVSRGRSFTADEVERSAPVMLVSQSLARLRWPNEDPIGRTVPPRDVLSGTDTMATYTVIGVVPDVRTNFLSRVNGPAVFYPHNVRDDFGAFLVRTHGLPDAEINAVRLAIAGISPSAAANTGVLTMEDGPMMLQRLLSQIPAAIALVLAVAGLALASIGIYGVVAQIVARRTKEIGVHIALGARARQIVALVLRKTLNPIAWGAACGAVGAVGMSIVLRSVIATPDAPDLTFGAGAFNPLVFGGVVATLGAVIAAACFVPTRRATRVDPIVALRAD